MRLRDLAMPLAAIALAGTIAIGGAWAAKPGKPRTVRISLKANGKEVKGGQSEYAAISASGQFVAFETNARLVKKDDANDFDVYVYNRRTKRNRLVSVRSNGSDGNNVQAAAADISPNGRYVCFGADGPLAPGDTNAINDVYRHDRKTQKTIRVSVRNDGSQLSGVNDDSDLCGVANNGVVAWETEGAFAANDTNNAADIYVRDPAKKTTRRATLDHEGNQLPNGGEVGKATKVAISGNGNFVAFQSFDVATADPDYGNAVDMDIFVRNLGAGKTTRASLKSNGEEAETALNAASGIPGISADGRYVVFRSAAAFVAADTNNTFDVYVRDRKLGRTVRASVKSNGAEVTPPGVGNEWPEISANGRYVVWDTSGNYGGGPDPNDFRDVYRRDLEKRKTRIVSLKTNGGRAEGNQLADVSNNGRWIAFQTMSKMTRQADDGMDWDVFLRGPLR